MSDYKKRNAQMAMWIPVKLLEELESEAKRQGVPKRTIVVRALFAYLFEGGAA